MIYDNVSVGVYLLDSYLDYHYFNGNRNKLQENIFLLKSTCKHITTGSGYLKHVLIRSNNIDKNRFINLYINYGFNIDQLYLKDIYFNNLDEFEEYLKRIREAEESGLNMEIQMEAIKNDIRADLKNFKTPEYKKSNIGLYIAGTLALALICSTLYKNFK